MTRKERISRLYYNLETDRPAVYSRTAFPPDDPTYDNLKRYLITNTELKNRWPGKQFDVPSPVRPRVEAYSEDFQRLRTVIETPMGVIQQTFLESLRGQPGMHETFYINSPEDAERYLSIPFPAFEGEAGSFFESQAAMGDAGIVEVMLGNNPAGMVVDLCGSHNFAMMSVTDREVLHRLCRREMEVMVSRIKFLLEKGAGPFFGMQGQEYIVPPLHGPKDFHDFNFIYDKPIIDLIHEAGGRMHIHCHGSVKTVLNDFAELGVDVLHPFEAPPYGDILPGEARELSGCKMCLEGNIQINRMYEASPDEIAQETESLIKEVYIGSKGLIVSPTASPYIRGKGDECFEQYKAMVETVIRN